MSLWYALSLLPFWILYLISDFFFLIVYYLVRYRRKVVRDNLSQSFPEKSLSEIIAIEKRFYHFFCDYIVETLKMCSISDKEMSKRMVFRGLKQEAVDIFEKEKKGFIFLYLGHYGNWEWITSVVKSIPDYTFVRGADFIVLLENTFYVRVTVIVMIRKCDVSNLVRHLF